MRIVSCVLALAPHVLLLVARNARRQKSEEFAVIAREFGRSLLSVATLLCHPQPPVHSRHPLSMMVYVCLTCFAHPVSRCFTGTTAPKGARKQRKEEGRSPTHPFSSHPTTSPTTARRQPTMPNPDGDDGKETNKEDTRQAVALMVPGADPPTLEKEERGVADKRKWSG